MGLAKSRLHPLQALSQERARAAEVEANEPLAARAEGGAVVGQGAEALNTHESRRALRSRRVFSTSRRRQNSATRASGSDRVSVCSGGEILTADLLGLNAHPSTACHRHDRAAHAVSALTGER